MQIDCQNEQWKEQPMADFEIKDPNFQERVRLAFHSQRFMEHLGAELTLIGAGFCEIQLPFREELTQQNGFFHGGIIGTLADNSMGFASFSLMGESDSVLTVEYKLNLVAPGQGEKLRARGEVIRPGRTLTVARADVFAVQDGVEKLCASAQSTMMRITT